MTAAEWKVWNIVRSGSLMKFKFRRQVPMGRYIADFASYRARLIIEVDGGQHEQSLAAERVRTKFLNNQGYTIVRFWNNDVLSNADGIYATIVGALAPDHPHPRRKASRPPPSRGRVVELR